MRKLGSFLLLFFLGAITYVVIRDLNEIKEVPRKIHRQDTELVRQLTSQGEDRAGNLFDEDLEAYEKALIYFDEGNYLAALELVKENQHLIESGHDLSDQWLHLYIQTAAKLNDVPLLVLLYQYNPEVVVKHEDAVLQIAEMYVNTGQTAKYDDLRAVFSDHTEFKKEWMLLDVDNYLFDGRRKEAIKTLEKNRFEGVKDVDRLLRLALLKIAENPKEAWDHLENAYALDRENSTILSYRGRLYEMAKKYDFAYDQYKKAMLVDPDNAKMKQQVADFYIRQKQYPQALEIMTKALAQTSDEDTWSKLLFWSRVTTPIKIMAQPYPDKNKAAFAEYLYHLKPWEFWNETIFQQLKDSKLYAYSKQPAFWLKLLSALKKGDEQEVQNILRENPFSVQSWHPELEVTLKRIAAYRANKSLDPSTLDIPLTDVELSSVQQMSNGVSSHPFFLEVNAAAALQSQDNSDIPAVLCELLQGNQAYLAVFVAAKWYEAGLDLLANDQIQEKMPDWLIKEIADAYLFNRGSKEALAFILGQQQTPEIQLKTAEIMVAEKMLVQAINLIEPLSSQTDVVGEKASIRLSKIHMGRGDLVQARLAVQRNPAVYSSVSGQEMLARIAILEGDDDLASYYYSQILDDSDEAKSFLARKAFREKNWSTARQLTIDLLSRYPNNKVLRENLDKIGLYVGQ